MILTFCSVWSEWLYRPCSASCGRGTLSGSRSCLDSNGDSIDNSYCDGDDSVVLSCHAGRCPRE